MGKEGSTLDARMVCAFDPDEVPSDHRFLVVIGELPKTRGTFFWV